MRIKLEAGKSYRTAGGDNTGPLVSLHGDRLFRATKLMYMDATGRLTQHDGNRQVYEPDGSVFNQQSNEENDRIVGEWVEPATSPVQTVKQLVAGTYGIVSVYKPFSSDSWRYELNKSTGTPAELRAAAATLIEIAEFIECSN